jgi:hypothetical protein
MTLKQLALSLEELDQRRGPKDLVHVGILLHDIPRREFIVDALHCIVSGNATTEEEEDLVQECGLELPSCDRLIAFSKLVPFVGTRQEAPSCHSLTTWSYDKPRAVMLGLLDAQACGHFIVLSDIVGALWQRLMSPKWRYPQTIEDAFPVTCPKNPAKQSTNERLSELGFSMHRMKAFLDQAIEAQMKEAYTSCLWAGCGLATEPECIESLVAHMTYHIKHASGTCLWMQCGEEHADYAELAIHLAHTHRVCSNLTQPHLQFCFPCVTFFFSIAAWSAHCAWHLENLSLDCGRILRQSIVIQPFICPHCLGDLSLPPHQRYRQFPTKPLFSTHMATHDHTNYCPHPLCNKRFESREEYTAHMTDHGIESVLLTKIRDSDVLRCKGESCGNQSFETVKSCYKHIRQHQTMHCPFSGCTFKYGTFRSLKKHMHVRHGIDELTCVAHSRRKGGLCKVRLQSSSDLDAHMARHAHADLQEIEDDCELFPEMSAFGISFDLTDQ